tara:strand:- start:824 stop:1195 length:372 start_codon:yes stop_codon:yes gene_type:complete
MSPLGMMQKLARQADDNLLRGKTLEEKIAYNRDQAKSLDERNDHKMMYSNPYEREVERLSTLSVLESLNINIKPYSVSGQVIINNRFIYVLRTGMWRVKGKTKWYYSKNPEHFVKKYVLKEID